jgi:8-oxo-dGTP pyrophosphatase MutT (NUDIX family)
MPVPRDKVFAYITHGDRLLVFSHPHAPEAGIQVPAGTVEPGEPFEAAVLREAWEETGLPGLTLARFLGQQVRDMADFGRDEVHHRYFYHLLCAGNPPPTWEHWEGHGADGSGAHLFAFFWARLPDEVPELIADHGAKLAELCAVLGLKEAG